MPTRISIIVPCYNAEKYLQETLDCLQRQTIDDWECIIVNDGSTDGSSAIAHAYAERDARYKVIDIENQGPSVARNIGIAASQGKYILPLDADDLIAETYAEDAIDYLEKHPLCKLVYGKAEFIGNKTGEWTLKEYKYETEIWENTIFNTSIYRRSDYDKTNGYNPNMRLGNEDWDFWLSLLNKNDEVFKLPYTVLYYRRSETSRSKKLEKNVEDVESVLRQMVLNHIDIYSQYFHYMFMANYWKEELDGIINSKTYRLGKILSYPLKLIQKYIHL